MVGILEAQVEKQAPDKKKESPKATLILLCDNSID